MSTPPEQPSPVWDVSVRDLQEATASSAPTPGGGSVAAVVAALGISLVVMALEVTLRRRDDAALTEAAARGRALAERARAAADDDLACFGAVMDAYRLPKASEREAAARAAAVAQASARATGAPLRLVEDCLAGLDLAQQVEPLVARSIVSDVRAGGDLLRGAARAALRTADINLPALTGDEQLSLTTRRDDLARRLDGLPAHGPAATSSPATTSSPDLPGDQR